MNLIIIGSSTGGPRILFDIFSNIPVLPATIIIVQHMPLSTTPRFAKRLSQLCNLDVIVPVSGEIIKEKALYIAPGDHHLTLRNNEEILLDRTEKVNFVRPSIDVTMFSVVRSPHLHITGIILSGMGYDGAEGMSYLKSIGASTIVQSPATCTIKSMPEAAMRGARIDSVLTPAEIKSFLLTQKEG